MVCYIFFNNGRKKLDGFLSKKLENGGWHMLFKQSSLGRYVKDGYDRDDYNINIAIIAIDN